jgi:hypothetical protein
VTGALAMCAFAALTQNYFIARNRAYESILLAAVVLTILRPYMVGEYLHYGSKYISYVIGLGLFGLTYLSQMPRARAAAREAAMNP